MCMRVCVSLQTSNSIALGMKNSLNTLRFRFVAKWAQGRWSYGSEAPGNDFFRERKQAGVCQRDRQKRGHQPKAHNILLSALHSLPGASESGWASMSHRSGGFTCKVVGEKNKNTVTCAELLSAWLMVVTFCWKDSGLIIIFFSSIYIAIYNYIYPMRYLGDTY